MNLMKIYYRDVEKIPTLSVLMLYRKSLKLIRTYPSITKDAMRETILIEYREKSSLTNPKDIDLEIKNAQGGLRHIYLNEIQRRQLNDIPIYYDEEEEKVEKEKLKEVEERKRIKRKIALEKQAKREQEKFEKF